MTEEARWQSVKDDIAALTTEVRALREAVSVIAVQGDRIVSQQKNIDELWRFHNDNFGPNGVIATIRAHQSSCPRGQIKFLWWFVSILGGVVGVMLTAIIHMAVGP